MTSRKSHGTAVATRVFAVGLVLTLVGLVFHPPSSAYAAGANQAGTMVRRKNFVISFENGRSVCRTASTTDDNQLAQRARTMPLHRLTLAGTDQNGQATNLIGQPGSEQTQNLNGIQLPGLNIILVGTTQLESFPQAKAAFVKAAANWQAVIQTPITVVIDVDFGPKAFGQTFPAGVIGSTDSQEIGNGSGFAPLRSALIAGSSNQSEGSLYSLLPTNTVVTDSGSTSVVFGTSATLRALGLMNPIANPDGEPSGAWGDPPAIAFNSSFNFDFDPTDGVGATQIDFDAVATHEIGHALGFTSEVGSVELDPNDPNNPLSVSVWDLFRFRPGTTLSTFTSATRIQHSGGTQVFYNGGPELALSTGRPDGSGGDSEQASHWKADEQNGGVFIGIMDPTIGNGQIESITNNDVLALNTMGYRSSTESPAPFAVSATVTQVKLTSGVQQSGSIPSSGDPNVCKTSDTQYRIQVPVDATQLTINLNGNQDVDVHARYGLPFISASGWPGIADYTSNSPNMSESITITPSSNLPLQPGLYFIAVDNCGASSANFTVTATVNSSTTTSAIDDTNFFVTQHYADFLNRAPDSGGLAFWDSQINNCGSDVNCIRQTRINVSDAFFFEPEYQQTAGYVFRVYRESYGNNQPLQNIPPDPNHPGEEKKLVSYTVFGPDRSLVVGGTSLAQAQLSFANAFVQRPEFLNKYPASLDGPGFVDAVLATLKNDIGVDLTSQRAALITLFNQGGRGNVIYKLADENAQTNPINNQAFIDAEYNRGFVETQYYGYLRRDPDTAGFLFWLGQINSAPLRDVNKQHALVCSFITSLEYQFRFGNVTTHSNGECPQ